MRRELQSVVDVVNAMPSGELPEVIGQLEAIKAMAWTRLTAPQQAIAQHDELLTVEQAAERLGMSEKYLYSNAKTLPFTKRMGRNLRFSANGIDRYIRQQR